MSSPYNFKALQDMATYAAFFGLEKAALYFNYDKNHLRNVISKVENFQLEYMKFYKKLILAMSTKEQTPIWEISDKLKIPIFVISQILMNFNDKQEKGDLTRQKRIREGQKEFFDGSLKHRKVKHNQSDSEQENQQIEEKNASQDQLHPNQLNSLSDSDQDDEEDFQFITAYSDKKIKQQKEQDKIIHSSQRPFDANMKHKKILEMQNERNQVYSCKQCRIS